MANNLLNGKYIIFSDVQGSREYLEKFFEATKNMKKQGYICLGDIIGSGEEYDDNFCIDLVRKNSIYCVRGNHEDNAEKSLSKITDDNKKYLKILPNSITLCNTILFHSSLKNTGNYLFDIEAVKEELDFISNKYPGIRMGLFGHTHKRGLFTDEHLEGVKTEKEIKIDKDKLTLINPGGIGVRWGADKSFAQIDFDNYIVRFFTLEEAENLFYLSGIVNSFDTTWMPALNEDSLGWFLEYAKTDALHIQKIMPDNKELADFGKILSSFDINKYHKTKKHDRKKYISEYSFNLAESLEKIAKGLNNTHQVKSPLEVRREYLNLKRRRYKFRRTTL